MIKTLQKTGIEGTYLNIVNAIYKPPAHIILNGKKLKAFPLRSEIRKGCPLSPLLFKIVLEVLAIAIRRNKRNTDQKRRSKALTICRWHDTVHKNLKDSIRKWLEQISEFGKVAGDKTYTHKSLAFQYTNNEKSEREIKESIPFTIATKKIKYLE